MKLSKAFNGTAAPAALTVAMGGATVALLAAALPVTAVATGFVAASAAALTVVNRRNDGPEAEEAEAPRQRQRASQIAKPLAERVYDAKETHREFKPSARVQKILDARKNMPKV